MFDGDNYHGWKKKMLAYLLQLGYDVLKVVQKGFAGLEIKDEMTAAEIKNLELDGLEVRKSDGMRNRKENLGKITEHLRGQRTR